MGKTTTTFKGSESPSWHIPNPRTIHVITHIFQLQMLVSKKVSKQVLVHITYSRIACDQKAETTQMSLSKKKLAHIWGNYKKNTNLKLAVVKGLFPT